MLKRILKEATPGSTIYIPCGVFEWDQECIDLVAEKNLSLIGGN